jgi:phage recombination protein Bet
MGTQTKEKKETERTLVPKQEKAVIKWQERNITVTFDDVKNSICPRATDQEVVIFLKMCQSLNLNPWERDIFMVKYGDEPASYIVASQAYLKAAEACPEFDGYEAGILIESDGEVKQREGAFLLDKEQNRLVGGYAKVYRKDRQHAFYNSVNIKECAKYTKEGKLTRFWSSMPATMIRKVALARALREAFPTRLGGMVSDAEYYEEIPEGTLPPAFEKPNGEKNWKHFWAKVKSELGLTAEQARLLLQVDSIKEELINEGWTMERIWDELVAALQKEKSKPEPQRIVDAKTGEVITQDEDLFGEGKAGAAAPAAPSNIARPETGVENKLAPEQKPAPSQPPAPSKPNRDPETIKTITELYRACHEDFKLQPKDILKELGYSSQADITELPSECYRKILAVRS